METKTNQSSTIGFIAIGRNEGDRLKAGLVAIQTLFPAAHIVYVDSGSTDDSVIYARDKHIQVVELDLSIPFTAARARNAGFAELIKHEPNLRFVQFLDGDCELLEGWVETAIEVLSEKETTAIVSGRRMEKFPEASFYNKLMDIEWDTPIGETEGVPGDMCVKVKVFEEINGFTEDMIAAEDFDLCIRAIKAGYKVLRIDADMSLHDANIMHLSQWQLRLKRGGHAYANINHLHSTRQKQYFTRDLLSAVIWGGLIPLAFILFLFIKPKIALAILILYTLFLAKMILNRFNLGDSLSMAIKYSALMLTGKISELSGVFEYWKNHLLSRKHLLIEYK